MDIDYKDMREHYDREIARLNALAAERLAVIRGFERQLASAVAPETAPETPETAFSEAFEA